MIQIVSMGASIAVVFYLAFLNHISPVDWADEVGDKKLWGKLSLVSALSGIAASLWIAFTWTNVSDLIMLAAVVAAGAASTVFVQALVTDIKTRKVDRRILNRGTIVTGLLGVVALVELRDWPTLLVAATFFAMGVFVYLFVFKIGASDARAMMFVAAAVIPVTGYFGFMWGIILSSLTFIVVAAILGVKNQSLHVSMPAVPVFLGPFTVVLLLSQIVNFTAI